MANKINITLDNAGESQVFVIGEDRVFVRRHDGEFRDSGSESPAFRYGIQHESDGAPYRNGGTMDSLDVVADTLARLGAVAA